MTAQALAAALAMSSLLASAAAARAKTFPVPSPVKAAVSDAPAPQDPAFRRFALVAGTNDGGARRMRLRYAASDAAAFAGVLADLGGVHREDLILLQGPGRREFLAAMDELRVRAAAAGMDAATGSARGRVEMLVYFSGHSDETGLFFGDEKVPYTEFRERIDAVPARIRLAVVDACASGALTRLKGGKRLPAFAVDHSSSLRGYAFLTSSSGDEAAQESDRIRASFFTHYLLTGLRGGADRNLDGKVTLGEAYEFAFHETLSQTEGSQAGAQHPSYDMRLDRGDAFLKSLVKVDPMTHQPVTLADFVPESREPTRGRGEDTAAAPAPALAAPPAPAVAGPSWIPARAALMPSLGFPGTGPGPFSHNFSFNLLVGEAASIHGMQLSLVSNHSTMDLRGMQVALLLNRAGGQSRGIQTAGFLNLAEGLHRGLQASLTANGATRLQGMQLAPVNGARRMDGLQLGLINTAIEGRGLQAGLLNVAGRQRGVQAGLVNIAGEARGAVLGPLNFVGNGFHDLETTMDEKSMLHNAILLGGPWNYTWYSFDMKARYPRHLWGGSAGLGLHLPSGPLFAGFDAGSGMLWNEEDWSNYSVTGRLRWLLGYQPMRYFSVFGGASWNIEGWPGTRYPNLNPGETGTRWGDARVEKWTGFFLGVRI